MEKSKVLDRKVIMGFALFRLKITYSNEEAKYIYLEEELTMFKNHELIVMERDLDKIGTLLMRPWLSRRIDNNRCMISFNCYGFKDWLETYKILFI